jgi:glutamine synthetase
MEYMKKIAARHGMACLLAEKPFSGINGSGKHNNWSLGTDTGVNLLKPGKKPAENKLFLTMLAATVKAVDEYQDLLRISAATAGNDYRLGGDEAPPAIISIFLGEELDAIIDSIIAGSVCTKSDTKYVSLGIPSVPSIRKDNTDRNRTSPFAFTGNKFEFRMVGASQNIALANIVLNTAIANSLSDFADRLEAANSFDTELTCLLAETFKAHRRILFSGNAYSPEWEKEAKERGLSNYKTAPEAYEHFTDEKNIALFSKFGVMNETEMRSRREIFFESYRKIKNIEARTMLEMTARDIIPAVSKYIGELTDRINSRVSAMKNANISCESEIADKLSSLLSKTYDCYIALERAEKTAMSKKCDEEAAFFYKDTVEAKMLSLRHAVDEMEILTSREAWPMPTYGDITFRI